jgi:glucose-6-phosphate isomerase, archaeal
MNSIQTAPLTFHNLHLQGTALDRLSRRIADLGDIFYDRPAFAALPKDTLVYEVVSSFPVPEGTEGGLFIGMTYIHPGKVGDEYFMTKGHFHRIRNRAEVYICLQGEGMLILMNEERTQTWAEKMQPGSIHYIDGYTAHRTANTGSGILSFGAIWPADAGHDYATISEHGFSKILVERAGIPTLVDRP